MRDLLAPDPATGPAARGAADARGRPHDHHRRGERRPAADRVHPRHGHLPRRRSPGRHRRPRTHPDAVRQDHRLVEHTSQLVEGLSDVSEFYALLGVERGATEAEIKKAYRKQAMELPSRPQPLPRCGGALQGTHRGLRGASRPAEARGLRSLRQGGPDGRGGAGFEYHHVDLTEALNIFMRDFGGLGGFESLFGGGGRPRAEARRRGQDIRVTVRMTLADVAQRREAHHQAQDARRLRASAAAPAPRRDEQPPRCGTCCRRPAKSEAGRAERLRPVRPGRAVPDLRRRGHGHPHAVRGVPRRRPGARRTQRPGGHSGRRLDQQLPHPPRAGASGPRNGPEGDLLVLIEVEDDERFERQGEHLVTDLPLAFSQAALGGDLPGAHPWERNRSSSRRAPRQRRCSASRGRACRAWGNRGAGDLHIRSTSGPPSA